MPLVTLLMSQINGIGSLVSTIPCVTREKKRPNRQKGLCLNLE